jgi:hypothetical protein
MMRGEHDCGDSIAHMTRVCTCYCKSASSYYMTILPLRIGFPDIPKRATAMHSTRFAICHWAHGRDLVAGTVSLA